MTYNDMNEYDLTKGNVWKVMVVFTVPIFLSIFLQSLYTTIDAIIIGRCAGSNALASIESVEKLIRIPLNFFVGLASAVTIIISQCYGAHEKKELSEAVHNAFMFAFVGGIVISLMASIMSTYFVELINVPIEIRNDAQTYLWIYFGGLWLLMIYNVGCGILRAVGDSKTPFYFIVISNCINIVLDLLFVGYLKLGVNGAAFATVLAQLVAVVMMITYLFKSESLVKVDLRKLKFYKKHMKEIVLLGTPIAIQATLFPISNMIVQSRMNALGIYCIAGWAIVGKLDFFVWYISEAFGISVSTFTAQNFGAYKNERIRKGVLVGLVYALLLVMSVSMLLYVYIDPLATLFVKDITVIRLASEMMKFVAPYYFLYVLCEILPSAIKGTGKTFWPMIVTLIFTCLTRIIWVSIVPNHLGSLKIVLFCYPLSWILTAIVFMIYYVVYFKKVI